jgi:endonuclease YncB( thermonuclease family)
VIARRRTSALAPRTARAVWAGLLGAAVAALASSAHADPCKAIPDHGRAPAWLAPGATFRGRVTYVGDGDSLCVAVGLHAWQWVEVRLEDFYAPELHAPGGEAAKRALSRLTFGRELVCRAGRQSYDRIIATCTREGRPVGDLLRDAGVLEGGRGYGRRADLGRRSR